MTTDERIVPTLALLADAIEIERVGGDWKVRHLMAVLGCSRASIYRDAWLMKCRIQQAGGPVWKPATIRRYQELRKGTKRVRRAS